MRTESYVMSETELFFNPDENILYECYAVKDNSAVIKSVRSDTYSVVTKPAIADNCISWQLKYDSIETLDKAKNIMNGIDNIMNDFLESDTQVNTVNDTRIKNPDDDTLDLTQSNSKGR